MTARTSPLPTPTRATGAGASPASSTDALTGAGRRDRMFARDRSREREAEEEAEAADRFYSRDEEDAELDAIFEMQRRAGRRAELLSGLAFDARERAERKAESERDRRER